MTPAVSPRTVIADQADQLRRMARERRGLAVESSRPGMIVAITSGKGGVGKTNLAVNLGLLLQSRGLRSTLVDLDIGLANADVLLDVRPRFTLREVVRGRRSLAEVATEGRGGLTLIAGASGPEGIGAINDIDRAKLADRLTSVSSDVLLLDCAAGIASGVMTFARIADVVLVVTTPEPTALTDAYAAIKTLLREGYGGSIRLVVNMVESRLEAREVYERLRGVCEKFIEYPIADGGYMLHDSYVELAVRQREPFVLRYPRCSASVCAGAIAARLASGCVDSSDRLGWLGRLAGMFT